MAEEEIFNRIAGMASECFSIDRDKITKDLDFRNDLDADSIDSVGLVMDLENTFEAEIPNSGAEKLQTVGEAVEYIKNHQN